MPSIRYDDRSFLLDDRRIWLMSGSVHYFRLPAGLWRDRLLKAKRAGLNCIETFVPWNFHEPTEGQWLFSGDHDVAGFVRLAGELGLHVILRPGPYIGEEWDMGGLPTWLTSKSGIAFRTANATYMHYLDKYLASVLGRLADLQVTRNGPIILIQNEREYGFTPMPDRLTYCQFINQLIRRAGFDIPVITCNGLSQPQVPDTIECHNGWDDNVQRLKQLRRFQPRAPMLATEFRVGQADFWGGSHTTKSPQEVARRAMEILGCGCQVNYYPFHGGTNFAFWGGKLAAGNASYQTTSHDCDAPVAEGGGLTPKYYLLRLVNLLASQFAAVFAQSHMEGPTVTVHDATQSLNLVGPAGRIAIITNNGRREIATARISLPDGTDLPVPLEPIGAVAIPIGIVLNGESVLDYTNVMPLGMFGATLVLHGPAGWEARISVGGKELRAAIPAGSGTAMLDFRTVKVLLINSEQAQRSWELDGSLLMGPDYVGATAEDVVAPKGMTQYPVLTAEGQLSHRKVKPAAAAPAPPKLSAFARRSVCYEPLDEELTWEKADRFKPLSAQGVNHGYGWYRLDLAETVSGAKTLFLPDCEDRATIYLNGKMAGVWGRGPGATREPMAVTFRRGGGNRLVVLADDLGREMGLRPQPRGLFGPIWDARQLKATFKLTAGGDFSRRMLPRVLNHMGPQLEQSPFWTAETVLHLPAIAPVHVSYENLPTTVIVNCNGRQAAFLTNTGGAGDVTLGNELRKGRNVISLLIWGDVKPNDLQNIKFHLLAENLCAGGTFAFRRWTMPTTGGRVVGKSLPAWYAATFKYAPTPWPLFLRASGAHKGQIYLNGHNLGRLWNIGPQEYYYLPEPLLREDNELLVFEEQGLIPSGSRLEFHAAPWVAKSPPPRGKNG